MESRARLPPPDPRACVPRAAPRLALRRDACHRLEKALRRFRKATNMSGHLRILRNRKTFESAHDKKIRKTKESAMRLARSRRAARRRM